MSLNPFLNQVNLDTLERWFMNGDWEEACLNPFLNQVNLDGKPQGSGSCLTPNRLNPFLNQVNLDGGG